MSRVTIFNATEIIEACAAAKAAGKGLDTVFEIATRARGGPNFTKYLDLTCKVPGKCGRLALRFLEETHVGQIPPLSDEEVARINNERGDKFGSPIKKRDRSPTIAIQKWNIRIRDGDPAPSGSDHLSKHYQVMALLNEFFREEMNRRIKAGTIIVAEQGRTDYVAGAVIVPSTKIVSTVQTHVSMNARTNAGQALANPICRMNIKFDKDTGLARTAKFYDYEKEYTNQAGQRSFEPLTFDGAPVTADNVHMISSRSIVNGVVYLDAVCASNMGLSIPSSVQILIVKLHVRETVSVADVFGDLAPGAPAPPAAAGAAESEEPREAAPRAANVDVIDNGEFQNVLHELSAGKAT